LRRQRQDERELAFPAIERILHAMLASSAAWAQWWSKLADPETTHVQRKAWRDAGYDAVCCPVRTACLAAFAAWSSRGLAPRPPAHRT